LRAADPVMGRLIEGVGEFGLQPDAEEPFLSLLRAIVYQQLSGKAAGTIFGRFLALFETGDGFDPAVRRTSPEWKPLGSRAPAPEAILAIGDEALRGAGLSRQKIASIRDLAEHAAAGELRPGVIAALPDEEVIAVLTRVRGVGRWTAEMYLIFHLGRPDVLPVNDVGINRAIQVAYGLAAPPKPPEVLRIGEPWRPWASVACWYLWRSLAVDLPTGPSAPPPPASE
jgi:DNA-3-methyladenine glycosylase II